MATKADLQEVIDARDKTIASLERRITKMEKEAGEPAEAPSDDFVAKVVTLVGAIDARGLSSQIGNRKEVSDVRDLLP